MSKTKKAALDEAQRAAEAAVKGGRHRTDKLRRICAEEAAKMRVGK